MGRMWEELQYRIRRHDVKSCDNCIQTMCHIKQCWDKHLFEQHHWLEVELIVIEADMHRMLPKYCGDHDEKQAKDE